MKKPLLLLPLALCLQFAMTSCEDGAAEDLGEKVDDAVDGVGDAAKDATDNMKDAASDAADDVEDAVDGH